MYSMPGHLYPGASHPMRSCYTCTHWARDPYDFRAVRCRQSGRVLVKLAASACAFWEREVGADDEVPSDELVGHGLEVMVMMAMPGDRAG